MFKDKCSRSVSMYNKAIASLPHSAMKNSHLWKERLRFFSENSGWKLGHDKREVENITII